MPAVFVCENNHWAESTPGWQHSPIEDLAKRAVAFGMHSITVDGQDVEAVYRAAVARARARAHGQGARSSCSRTRTGSPATTSATRRSTATKDESARSRETQDPIEKLREKLGLSDDEFEALDREVHELVEASVEFAKAGTDPKPEDALKNVYA